MHVDESRFYALIQATYGIDEAQCEEMTEGKFRGLWQNLDFIENRRAFHLAKAIAPLLGIKLSGG